MTPSRIFTLAATLLTTATLFAATASEADKSWQSKVSQGGMYEVESSKLAEQKATAQDVKDQATTEVHDHTLVGAELKRLSSAASLPFPSTLNSEFQQRLAKLKSTPAGPAFDAAYIADMKQIHDKDEKLFAQESHDGTPAFQPFAAMTDRIVKHHIATLNAF